MKSNSEIPQRGSDNGNVFGITNYRDTSRSQAFTYDALAIQMALHECDFFALCLSDNSVERRGFLQREIKIALDKLTEFLPDDIYFIPIRLAKCPRPPQIARYQTLDLFEPDGYERLVIALREGATRRRKGMR